MISSKHLNKFINFLFLIFTLIFYSYPCFSAVDIWEKKEKKENGEEKDKKNINIESPILSEDINKIVIKINEDEIENKSQTLIGIFDPQKNNSVWVVFLKISIFFMKFLAFS